MIARPVESMSFKFLTNIAVEMFSLHRKLNGFTDFTHMEMRLSGNDGCIFDTYLMSCVIKCLCTKSVRISVNNVYIRNPFFADIN